MMTTTPDPVLVRALCSFAFCARKKILHALRTAHAALREIFDEAAYDRYLQQTGAVHSRASFAKFLAAGKQSRERRPRCC